MSLFSIGMYAWNNCATGPWVSFNFADGYTVYQNGWGSGNYQAQQLCANSAGNWRSSGSYTGGGVKCYPHTQKDVNLPINANGSWCSASFNCSAPNNGTWYNFMFDCWTADMKDELIISEMWNGDAVWGDLIAQNVTIGGRQWNNIRKANNGANNVLVFTPNAKRSSGTEDLMALFTWAKNNGHLVSNSTLYQVSFGVEITYTNGWQEFTCNSFSINFGQNSGSGSGNVSIQNRATGLYIDGMGRNSNGSNVGQWSGSSSNNQKWTMETSGNNVKFKNVATGLYLDGMGRNSNGSLVGQWGGSSSWNQQWIVETYGNYKRIKNAATGLYIDGMYWSSNGSDLGQWSNGGSDAQQWTITSLKSARENPDEISSENNGNCDIVLFPNPFVSEIILKIGSPEQVTSIVVLDMLGKQVEIIDYAGIKMEQTVGSSLMAGVYVVKVYGVNWTKSYKIVKK